MEENLSGRSAGTARLRKYRPLLLRPPAMARFGPKAEVSPCARRSLGADDEDGHHVADDEDVRSRRPQIAELLAARGGQSLNDGDIGRQILRQAVPLFLS